ncbi:MAG: aminodeoxychorismate synthase component I [Bacteroidetes Order II. Incertae sedis bacterium]|nr:aminodeoxychorismate synthase component I [Bacteroidetes Order II. bacterium]
MIRSAGTLLFETTYPEADHKRVILFRNPITIYQAATLTEIPHVIDQVEQAVDEGYFVAGFLTYEAGYAFVPIPHTPPLPPVLAWFGVYNEPENQLPEPPPATFQMDQPQFNWTPDRYAMQIDTIRDLIQEGDVYQINFTGKMSFPFRGDAFTLYQQLRQQQAVRYSAFIQTETQTFLSLSPELFFQRNGQQIETRPMKGTIQRGRNVREDRLLADQLQKDEKSRAENLMIVDLLRNDLSKVCVPGTVRVSSLFDIETYRSLHQMTSTITGTLSDTTTYTELFQALFPCGSVTGAPKKRAMERIASLETEARGLYCGSVGYITPNHKAVFSVAIRTAELSETQGTLGVGSGVVWDSNAQDEYEECLLKARFLTETPTPPFELIETIHWNRMGAVLLAYHMERMEQSALYFQIPFQKRAFYKQIASFAATPAAQQPSRLRITLKQSGEWHHTSSPLLQGQPPITPKICVSPVRTQSADPFYQHKTSHRALYEAEWSRALANGFGEIIFLNEKNMVTEGSRSNIFIRRRGRWLTPPCTSGVLPGVFRRFMLEQSPYVYETELTLSDLVNAEEIRLCNAIWQWTPPVQLILPDQLDTI